MNGDKQIEEMYKDVYEAINHNAVIDIAHGGYIGVNTDGLTRELYDDGYRKVDSVTFMGGIVEQLRAEVAREIFEEIDRMCLDTFGNFNHRVFAELKKKYTEEVK